MKGVKIIKHKPINEDERGKVFRERPEKPLKELLTVMTKKGAIRGRHYHKGEHPSKNPERFVVSGKINLCVRDLSTNKEETFILKPLSKVRVYPNIYHYLEALEDSTFIELKPEIDDYKDVYTI